ncbi:MAG: hypothetical protein RIQ33_796 [Bacteroidota bacterium]|jgi:hypothetical protein
MLITLAFQIIMKYKLILLLIAPIAFVLQKCQKAPDFPIIPAIVFESFNKTNIAVGTDSLILKIKFTDGDGDIGFNQNEYTGNDSSVLITDVRVGKLDYTQVYNPPHIPEKGSFKQISGTMSINLTRICSCRPDHLDTDTLLYRIKIFDRARHQSNVITTPYIYLKCN